MKKNLVILLVLFVLFINSLAATPDDDILDAAKNGDLPKAEAALKVGADINYEDSENKTALYFAYEKEKTDVISYLKKNVAKETNLTNLCERDGSCAKEISLDQSLTFI